MESHYLGDPSASISFSSKTGAYKRHIPRPYNDRKNIGDPKRLPSLSNAISPQSFKPDYFSDAFRIKLTTTFSSLAVLIST